MRKVNPSLVHGKVAVTPDHSSAGGSATGFKLFTSVEIASDAGDLSLFTDAANDKVTRSAGNATVDNHLVACVENWAATTAEILLADLRPSQNLTMPEAAEAIFTAAGCHEIAVRLLSSTEMSVLNRDYRGKDGATNVLSFPALDDAEMTLQLGDLAPDWCAPLGDIAICTDVVWEEARQQGKPAKAHLAHMVVHGMLHLLGYDHLSEQEAGIMEATEARVLAGLGFDDPYIAVQHEVTKTNS